MVAVVVIKMEIRKQTQEIFKTTLLMGLGDGSEMRTEEEAIETVQACITGWMVGPLTEMEN